MEIFKELLSFFSTLLTSWPFIILIIFILIVSGNKVNYSFKRRNVRSYISKFIGNIKSLKIKDIEASFKDDLGNLMAEILSTKVNLDKLSYENPKKSILHSYEHLEGIYKNIVKIVYPESDFNLDGEIDSDKLFKKLLADNLINNEYYEHYTQLSLIIKKITNNEYKLLTPNDALLFRSQVHDMISNLRGIEATILIKKDSNKHHNLNQENL
ncbi:hypothetical protein [Enterococcus sp. UD-01]|uniref:hypothetical protein n=1 Tax=Enterococcus sp. UD-01 TaxID=3373911 RepID=UPI00383832D5